MSIREWQRVRSRCVPITISPSSRSQNSRRLKIALFQNYAKISPGACFWKGRFGVGLCGGHRAFLKRYAPRVTGFWTV